MGVNTEVSAGKGGVEKAKEVPSRVIAMNTESYFVY